MVALLCSNSYATSSRCNVVASDAGSSPPARLRSGKLVFEFGFESESELEFEFDSNKRASHLGAMIDAIAVCCATVTSRRPHSCAGAHPNDTLGAKRFAWARQVRAFALAKYLWPLNLCDSIAHTDSDD